MRLPLFAGSFLAGCLGLQLFSHLPAIEWLLLLPLLLVGLYFNHRRSLSMLLILLSGGLWSLLSAHTYALHVLPESLADQSLWVTGVIDDIPQQDGHVLRFELAVQQLESGSTVSPPQRLRLSWYNTDARPLAGETWRLLVKLKPPHGFQNPGGFDYERWLYQRGIHATGYIKNASANMRIRPAPWYSVDRLRQRIANHFIEADGRYGGLWAALSVGYKGAMSAQQWDILTATGTNHLMAISGLHIGLIAGLVFWISRRLLPMFLLRYVSGDQIAAVLSLLAAVIYACLAGFAVPTQRALVMLAVVLFAILLGKPVRAGQSLALALLLVLIIDPRSVLAAGFWFSFLAVAVIAYSFAGRLGRGSRWKQWGRIQWVIAILLFPLSLFMFQQGSLAAPLANLIAVPLVSLLVVPLVLLSLLATPLPLLGGYLMAAAEFCMDLLWPLLAWLAQYPLATWQQHWSSLPLLILACVGVLLLLAPRGVPQRWLGLVLVMPGLLDTPDRPPQNGFWVTLLDVGQGLAVYVETREHNLLFDTGARFSPRFDIGDRVVLPFLRSRGVGHLDKLIVSHGDNDHSGGADSIMQAIPVIRLEGRDLERLQATNGTVCHAGQSWTWDGVSFSYLHPDRDYAKTNNHACVLQVRAAAGSLLIASDIEATVEARMLQAQASRLDADVLVVPHHGSKTSSTSAWIDAVNPQYALISAGYRNRFGHPAKTVIQRYQARQIQTLNTADSGAIQIRFQGQHKLRASRYRQQAGRYWHHWTLR